MDSKDFDRKTVADVKKLDSFPDQSSHVPAGLYTVKCTEEKSVPPDGEDAPSDTFTTDIWFETGPLKRDTIERIQQLKVLAETHDQGFCDNPDEGNWTWVELVILEKPGDSSPKIDHGIKLVWFDHEIRHDEDPDTGDYEWRHGAEFHSDHKLLRLLQEGNSIAVRLCARFSGWQISAKTGFIVLDIASEPVDRHPIDMERVAQTVARVELIHDTMKEVNLMTGAAFQPELSTTMYRADSALGVKPQEPLRVLAIDGGGARGLSSLLILQAVMEQVAPGKEPWEVFDMIGGTSTGGLIAIMLGRLRMRVVDCIAKYRDFNEKLFDHGLMAKGGRMFFTGDRFSARTLEHLIKQVVKEQLGGNENDKLLDQNPPTHGHDCKVFVLATNETDANNREPVFLRSYQRPDIKPNLPDIQIWQAARATSAAPTYFEPIEVGGVRLIDGGLGANNPLGWCWHEALAVYGAKQPIKCFLSLGTGMPANEALPEPGIGNLIRFTSGLSSVATNTEIVNILFSTLINAYAPEATEKKYWRLNVSVPKGEGDYVDPGDMADLEALKKFVVKTQEYVKNEAATIKKCAEALRQGA